MCACKHHGDVNAPCTCSCESHAGVRAEMERMRNAPSAPGSVRERLVVVGRDDTGDAVVLEQVETWENPKERLAFWSYRETAKPWHRDVHLAVESVATTYARVVL